MPAEPRQGDGRAARDLCVVGNVLIDLMMSGLADLPRWGEEVLSSGRAEEVGGQGANLARAAAHIGCSTSVLAAVGDDPAGQLIGETLRAEGIATDGIEVLAGPTALAIAAIRRDGERAFITDLGASAALTVAHVAERSTDIFDSRAVALVGTANLPGIELGAIARVLEAARGHGVITAFDPGWSDDGGPDEPGFDDVLRATDLFLPNRDEAQALTGATELSEMLHRLGERCAGQVIVTCGPDGSACLDGGQVVIVEALPVPVDNALGAGDVFAAGAISGWLDDRDPVAAMTRGTAVAARFLSAARQRFAATQTWRELIADVRVRCL
jgi:sugar/nucleoside kinase (ribokinase family)